MPSGEKVEKEEQDGDTSEAVAMKGFVSYSVIKFSRQAQHTASVEKLARR